MYKCKPAWDWIVLFLGIVGYLKGVNFIKIVVLLGISAFPVECAVTLAYLLILITNPADLDKDAFVVVTAWNVFDDIKSKLVS